MTAFLRPQHPPQGGSVPAVLRPLITVVCAVIAREGRLCDANAGFLRLIGGAELRTRPADVRDLFVNPRFDQFAARRTADVNGTLYTGILNVGDIHTQVRSLRGTISTIGRDLFLLAEHDVAELEQRVETLQSLNQSLSAAHREISRLERKLEQRSVTADGAIADRDVLLDLLSTRMGERQNGKHRTASSQPAKGGRFVTDLTAEWTEDVSTGITVLDAEHAQLIRCYSAVVQSLRQRNSLEAVKNRFCEFLETAVAHFAHEEKIMKKIGYPGYFSHRVEHECLVKDLQQYYLSISEIVGTKEESDIAKYLKTWLVRHIWDKDKQILAYISG